MTTIELNKKEFIKTLNVGGTFAGKTKVMPILECVKVKVSNGHLKVISSDNENAISKDMLVTSADSDAVFCVNCRDLSSYVKMVGDETVTLAVDENEIQIKHEKGDMTLPVMKADDFPMAKMDDNCVSVHMDSALLNNWIVDARDFVRDDDLRPVLNNIYFYCKESEMGCCGTDGLFMFADNVLSNNSNFEFKLNKSAFKAVCDVCAESDNVSIKIGERNVMFAGDGITVIARMWTDNFPNFKSVIPANNPINVKVSKKELADAINRVKLGASQASCLVKFDISGSAIKVSAQDIDFNRKAVENIAVEANGEITIGFNANKFLICMNAVSTDNVVLLMSESSRACLLADDDSESRKTVLIMPMMLE